MPWRFLKLCIGLLMMDPSQQLHMRTTFYLECHQLMSLPLTCNAVILLFHTGTTSSCII